MAIAAAFNSPEVDIIGFTTIFGNVLTPTATANCFVLLKLAGQEQVRGFSPWPDCTVHFRLPEIALWRVQASSCVYAQIPVAEGSSKTLNGLARTHVADFVHGTDGFGNTKQAAVQVCDCSGSEVL